MTIGNISVKATSGLLIGLLLSGAGYAQEKTAVVSGTVEYETPTVLHIMTYDKATQSKQMDSAVVKDGSFSFSVPFKGLAASVMIIASHNAQPITQQDASDVKSVLLNESGATIHVKDRMREALVTGGQLEDEKKRYIKYTYLVAADSAKVGYYINAVSPIMMDVNLAKIPDSTDKEAFANYQKILQFRKTMKDLVQQKLALQRKFIPANPDSYFCLAALEDNIHYGNTDDIMPLFNKMSDRLKNSQEAKQVLEELKKAEEKKLHPEKQEDKTALILNRAKPLEIGQMAPDFTLPDADGKTVRLADFKGKYVLVDFWASWCVPCRKESPNVIKAYQRFKDKNFTVISVALEEKGSKEAWLAAIKKDGLLWKSQLVDYENAVAGKLYNISAIPYCLLLDPTGRIVAINLRGAALQDKLAEFLSGF